MNEAVGGENRESNTAPTEHQKMRPILPLPKADVQSRLHSCLQLALKIVNIASKS